MTEGDPAVDAAEVEVEVTSGVGVGVDHPTHSLRAITGLITQTEVEDVVEHCVVCFA